MGPNPTGGWAMYPLGICSLITFSSLPMYKVRRVLNASQREPIKKLKPLLDKVSWQTAKAD